MLRWSRQICQNGGENMPFTFCNKNNKYSVKNIIKWINQIMRYQAHDKWKMVNMIDGHILKCQTEWQQTKKMLTQEKKIV